MRALSFIFIYAFEQFVAFTYMHNKFEFKKSKKTIIFCFALSFILQYGISTLRAPYLNLILFFFCNFLISLVCFRASFRQSFFNIILLVSFMITSEFIVRYLMVTLLNMQLMEIEHNGHLLFYERAASKIFYFICIFIISKISCKIKPKDRHNDFSLMLFILPLSSIFTIISFAFMCFHHQDIDKASNLFFTIISFVLLSSNIVVFMVHERAVATLRENASLNLEKQRAEINKVYYIELQRQYDTSNILIHDIKKHLNVIRTFSKEKDCEQIDNYIDSIFESNDIHTLRQFSNNKLVNIIVSRYAYLCQKDNINFAVDIRNIDFSFISDNDLTALMDNLMENAYEATKKSESKTIEISIEMKNEQYVLFHLVNSSDVAPQTNGYCYISSKKDDGLHGIGLQSISRIANKYNGYCNFKYDSKNKVFNSSVLLKIC